MTSCVNVNLEHEVLGRTNRLLSVTETLTLQIEYYDKCGKTLLSTRKYAKQNKYKLDFIESQLRMYQHNLK